MSPGVTTARQDYLIAMRVDTALGEAKHSSGRNGGSNPFLHYELMSHLDFAERRSNGSKAKRVWSSHTSFWFMEKERELDKRWNRLGFWARRRYVEEEWKQDIRKAEATKARKLIKDKTIELTSTWV